MAERRKLIVVSNRGPISYGRERRRADRPARRRRPRHGARAARLASRRHLDRERDLGRGPCGRGGGHGRRDRRATARATGSGSSRTSPSPTTSTTTWSRTRRSGSSSTGSGSSSTSPGATSARPGTTGYVAGQPRLRRRGRRGARARAGRGGLLPRLPPLPRAGARARAAARASRWRTSRTFPGSGRDGWSVLPERDRAVDPRGPARERRRRLPHAALAAARSSTRARGLGPRARTSARVTAHPISIDPAEFDGARAQRARAARERERDSATRPRRLILRVDRTDPSKNVAARPRGVRRSCSSAVPTCAARSACSPCSTLPPGDPGVRRGARRIEAAAAAVERALPRRRSTLRIADDFPASIAAYKQFDVLLVNAVLDGLNLVAKEAPLVNERDGVVVLSVNAGAYEELGDWASRSTRSTSRARPTRSRRRSRSATRSGAHGSAGDQRARARARPRALDRRAACRPRPRRVRCRRR